MPIDSSRSIAAGTPRPASACRKERALKDYSRDASAIVTDSNDQVSKPFFELLQSGKSTGNDLQGARVS